MEFRDELKLAPPWEEVSPLLEAWELLWVQEVAYDELEKEREMEEEEIYKDMALEVHIYSMK